MDEDLKNVEYVEEQPSESSGEENIQAKLPPVKEKRPRTEAQKRAWAKATEVRLAKRAEKTKENAEKTRQYKEQLKKEMEDRIVKKAVSIKKKVMKKALILDEISDDDEPVEEVIQKVRASRQPKERIVYVPQPPPAYIFV